MFAMKNSLRFPKQLLILVIILQSIAGITNAQDDLTEIKGLVMSTDSKKPLISAKISLVGTNLSTITNTEGKFTLKFEDDISAETLLISSLGYKNKKLEVSDFGTDELKIYLKADRTELNEVSLNVYKDPQNLVRQLFSNKAKNNLDQSIMMTAFYRETIKRRRTNVSLTEAVVNLHKKSYMSRSKDEVELEIARKKTNYKKLDTLAFKLQGGPFTTLYLDIMKYPEYIFTDETIPDYDFSFDKSSTIDDKSVYVVNFQQKETVYGIRYRGKLFIDAESLALTSANYSLNLENKALAKNYLTKKKPRGVVAYPTEASYKIDYKEKNGKWYYAYARVNLTFKVNKKRTLFNQKYTVSSEMAVTDWDIYDSDLSKRSKDRLKPNMILTDRVSGFADPNFWGEYNLIEPEKSIESAIEKIRKQIEKEEKRKS